MTKVKIKSHKEDKVIYSYSEAQAYAIKVSGALFRTTIYKQLVYFDISGNVIHLANDVIAVGRIGWEDESYELAKDEVDIKIKND